MLSSVSEQYIKYGFFDVYYIGQFVFQLIILLPLVIRLQRNYFLMP